MYKLIFVREKGGKAVIIRMKKNRIYCLGRLVTERFIYEKNSFISINEFFLPILRPPP